MSGTISLSLSQQFDSSGDPLDGGLLSFFQAGTTTPQSAYQDTALTIPHPNPIVLDAAGRVPQFFLADGEIKIRLTNAEGVTQLAADNILVIGASSGSGGTSVDATKIASTGDIKHRYGTGSHTGWVPGNGRTIGSVTSSATQRANADTEALFLYLWDADANLAVSTGRGANAAADWAANKNIALPDFRGRVIAALDDMENVAAGRLTNTYFGTGATTLGAAGGTQSKTLLQENLPDVALPVTDPGHVHPLPFAFVAQYGAGGISAAQSGGPTGSSSATTGISVETGGSDTPVSAVQPTMLATIYLKL